MKKVMILGFALLTLNGTFIANAKAELDNGDKVFLIGDLASTLAVPLVSAIGMLSEHYNTRPDSNGSSNSTDSGSNTNTDGSSNSATCVSGLFHKQLVDQLQNDAIEYQASGKEQKSTLLISLINKVQEINPDQDEDSIINELLSIK